MLGGKAADLFGARHVSVAGLAVFGVASSVIALASGEATLLAGRALQGLSAAFAVPSTLAAVGTGATPQRRAVHIGAWSGFLTLGFSVGPLFGGLLTHTAGWRVIFWLNIPLICIASAGLAAARLVLAHRDGPTRHSTDWLGFILLATAMVSIVLILQALPGLGRPAPRDRFTRAGRRGVTLLLIVEQRAAAPLIDLGSSLGAALCLACLSARC